jgi:hypothetical protein
MNQDQRTYDVYNLRRNFERILVEVPFTYIEDYLVNERIPFSDIEIKEA